MEVHWKIQFLGEGGGYEKPINRSGDCLKKEDIAKKWSDVFEGGWYLNAH